MSKIQIFSVEQFEKEWDKIFRPQFNSSAAELEVLLFEKNITPNVKIFHKYKLPENLVPEEFEKKLKKLWGHLTFNEDMVSNFFIINQNVLKDLKKEYFLHLKNLKTLVEYIKKNNPELSSILTKNKKDLLALVDGACYGFSPEDIKYFIDSRGDSEKNFKNNINNEKLEQVIEGSVSYKMSPERTKDLAEYAKTQKNFNTYMDWRESRGMGDD
jgi:hypothetical protein